MNIIEWISDIPEDYPMVMVVFWLVFAFLGRETLMDFFSLVGSTFQAKASAVEIQDFVWGKKEEIAWVTYSIYYCMMASHAVQQQQDSNVVDNAVNVSLSWVSCKGAKGVLKFRTLREVATRDIFLDYGLRKRVKYLAKRTKLDQPFLEFEVGNRRDEEIKKTLTSYVSSFNTLGLFALELDDSQGHSALEEKYVIGLTNEQFGGKIGHKLRLMVVRSDMLETGFRNRGFPDIPADEKEEARTQEQWNLYVQPKPDDPKWHPNWQPPRAGPAVSEIHHVNRLKVLKQMATLFHSKQHMFCTSFLPVNFSLGGGGGCTKNGLCEEYWPPTKRARTSTATIPPSFAWSSASS